MVLPHRNDLKKNRDILQNLSKVKEKFIFLCFTLGSSNLERWQNKFEDNQ